LSHCRSFAGRLAAASGERRRGWYYARVAESTGAAGFSAAQSWKRTALELGVVALVAVALFFLGRNVLGCAAEAAAMQLPASVDAKIGSVAAEQIRATHFGKAPSEEQVERVARIFAEVVSKLEPAEKSALGDPRVTVVVDQTPNAFALPGGEVFVLTGLLERVGTGDDGDGQLRGVLAHELGHAVRRHGVRLLARRVAFNVALALIFSEGDTLTNTLVGGAAQLQGLSNSRGMETEADDFGVGLLERGGFDREGLARFLESLGSQPVPQILSTHPDPVARAKRIREQKQ
jgi:predicted Zn-dependent protease